MTKPLSDPVFEQLSPLLANIAFLISANTPCSDTQLLTLLEAIDLEKEEGTHAELRKWATLLQKVYQDPSTDQRMATIEALQLRGLSKAQVLLAVDTVCSMKSSPSLKVHPVQLVWNNLSPGETVEATLNIEGGPGQLKAENDHIILNSTSFSGVEGEVNVTINPLSPGSILNSSIRIITKNGQLDIPVMADWKLEPDRIHIDTQTDLIVSLDEGSLTLIEALVQAEPGQSILIRRGTYFLVNPLLIENQITLVGEGQGETRLIGRYQSYLARISTSKHVEVKGISFIHEGKNPGDCIIVEEGEVFFTKCSFQGAVYDKVADTHGAGLRLTANSHGRISNCNFYKNECNGIWLGGNSNFRLIENICKENRWSGIAYFGNSGGTASNNLCENNGKRGIYIAENAQPNLEANTCRRNKWSGISYYEATVGTAKENLCENNELYGIAVGANAQPILVANTCFENKNSGIYFFGNSEGTAKQNVCNENGEYGIVVGQQSKPELNVNTCSGNRNSGIFFFGTAAGTVKNNLCERNGNFGVYINSRANPILEANTFGNNTNGDVYRRRENENSE